MISLGRTLLWFAAGYQIFDGLNLGAGFCLRGAGDMRVPTLAIIFLSWFGFVPFTHMFTFAPGQGWVDFLPQFGYGTVGGWAVALVYTCLLGSLIYLRWRSGAWRKIDLRLVRCSPVFRAGHPECGAAWRGRRTLTEAIHARFHPPETVPFQHRLAVAAFLLAGAAFSSHAAALPEADAGRRRHVLASGWR